MPYRFLTEQWIERPLEEVFRFFADPGNLVKISPPGARIEGLRLVPAVGVEESGGALASSGGSGKERMAGAGTEIFISFPLLPGLKRGWWLASIEEFEYPRFFRDVQVRGPLRSWNHRHMFQPMVRNGRTGTTIIDYVEYEVGFGALGAIANAVAIRWQLRAMFKYRQRATARLLGNSGEGF